MRLKKLNNETRTVHFSKAAAVTFHVEKARVSTVASVRSTADTIGALTVVTRNELKQTRLLFQQQIDLREVKFVLAVALEQC